MSKICSCTLALHSLLSGGFSFQKIMLSVCCEHSLAIILFDMLIPIHDKILDGICNIEW
jgi:hypothetical protein